MGNPADPSSYGITLPHDGSLVMMSTVGSTAYGLATENSDIDRLGVYVARSDHVWGLDGATAVKNTVTRTDPDVTVHEIGKFCSLALKGNPTILELLFLWPEIPSQEAADLIENRMAFLGANNIRNAYGGYATQQARRLLNRHKEGKEGFNSDLRNRTEKHGRHCYRLLVLGRQLLSYGWMDVDLSSRREEIFAVGRLAVDDPQAFEMNFRIQRDRLDAVEATEIPAEPNRALVNDLLIKIRLRHL